MKKSILLSVLLSGVSFAGFESWTNKDGKVAELELLSVSESDGEKVGEFKMRSGRTVSLKQSELAEADAERLANWKQDEAAPAETSGAGSVFDRFLDGNLEVLQGRSFRKVSEPVRPTKYYLFYYTASWCGPCQKFTPSLVEFYNKHKPGNNEFEVVLITSDSSEGDMKAYAIDKEMTWPHLKLSRVDRFKKEFKHPGGGIPNLVLTDLDGNILKKSYEGTSYLGPTVVMNHLGSLLKK